MATHVQNRRVGFRALPPPNIHNAYSSGSDSEEDEEERIRREEEAEEAALSKRYGEAGEAPNNKKRDAEKTEEEIEAEYARRAKKKPRPTLTLNQVISKLPFVKNEFAASLKYPRKANKVDSAAAFSRNLQRAYKNFCYDLFPSMAYEDVLVKIESFGSKKELKSYLQTMRDDIRKQHLEKIYGETKAEQFLQELEHGLKQQQRLQEEDRMEDVEESSAPPVENPYNLRGHGDASSESVEENQHSEGSQQDEDKSETSENLQDNNTDETPTENSRGNQEAVDNNDRDDDDTERARTSVAVEKRTIYESSSDEEEEADFLDIVGKPADDDQAPTDAAAKEANNNTAEKRKEEENVEVREDIESSTADTDKVEKAAVEETNTTLIDTNDEEKSSGVADGSNKESDDDHAEVLDDVGKRAKGGETGAEKKGEQLGTTSSDKDSNQEDEGNEVVGNAMDVDSEESVETETQDEQPPSSDSFLSQGKETVPASKETVPAPKTVGTSVEKDSSSETRTIVPTQHTDDNLVFTAESDETATIVPTQATTTQGGLSDETATIVPTLSETQQTTPTPVGPSSSQDDDVIQQERENKAHLPTESAAAGKTGIDSTE